MIIRKEVVLGNLINCMGCMKRIFLTNACVYLLICVCIILYKCVCVYIYWGFCSDEGIFNYTGSFLIMTN